MQMANKTHTFLYLAPCGSWYADLSCSEYRHERRYMCEHGTQERLPFGRGADWRCVRDWVQGRYMLDEISVDILSR
jgi:hypothetical protein